MMNPSEKRSLAQTLIYSLVLIGSLIAILTGFLSYGYLSHKSRIQYEKKLEEYLAYLDDSLALPVWRMDKSAFEKICMSFVKNDSVELIQILDEDGDLLFETGFPVKSDPIRGITYIHHRNENIGQIVLELTPVGYKQKNKELFLASMFMAVVMIAVLGLATKFILTRFLKTPLEELIQSIQSIASGNYHQPITDYKQREIASISNEFNRMVEQVKTREKSLIKTKEYLEKEISERKQAEKELKEFAQRLSIHVEQTPLGVIEWDLDFKVTQWNNAAENIFGYSKKEAIGQTGLELIVPKEVHNLVQPVWDDLINGKGGAQATNKNITKDRKSIVCEWYNTTLLDSDGIVIGIASLVQDITDQKHFEKEKAKLEKQLQQSQKMEAVGTLAGGVAHDFNNILGIILGYSDMLKTDLSLDASSDEKLDQIINAGNRAKDLVSQILAFSRQNKKEFIPIQPDRVINEALKMLRSSIPTTIKIESSISKSGSIIGDPTQLHQIVMNLCTNAYHAMRETGGLLKVLLEPVRLEESDTQILSLALPPGPYLKLEISDNGYGMDKTTQQKIFDPYFTTKKRGEGTGLGLSVVHGIVKHFGGQISVYSEIGKGTVFRIHFPQITTEAEIAINRSNEANPTGNEHILVVDDEKPIVEMEKFMLEGLGYRVSTCTSSPEAFKVFQNQHDDISLVVTDMTMPDMTGIELMQKIRAIRSDIPIILCSGFSELISEEKAKYISNLKYLKKPVLKKDFALAIREILDNDNSIE